MIALQGGIRLLDMDLDFVINCTDRNVDFCNFAIHIDLNWDLFKKMLDREIGLALQAGLVPTVGPDVTIFKITELSLTQWSAQHYAEGTHPYWQIGITVLDKPHLLHFRVEQYQLAGSFHEFFVQWLQHIFFAQQ